MTPFRRVMPTLTNSIRPIHRRSRLPLVSNSTLCNQRRTFFGNSGGGNNGGPYVVPTPVNIGFCVVPQQTAYVIERLGKYSMVSLVHTDCALARVSSHILLSYVSSKSIHLQSPPATPPDPGSRPQLSHPIRRQRGLRTFLERNSSARGKPKCSDQRQCHHSN